MKPPAFWGIDPRQTFKWVPSIAREVLVEYKEAVPAKGDVPAVPAILPEYGKPIPGAPWIELGAMPERISIRINAARQKYYTAMARARAKVSAGGNFEDATGAVLDRLADIYPEDLQIDTISAVVKAWGGFAIPYSGNWEECAPCLPGYMKAELFRDIVDGSAFTAEEVEAFTSPQESTPN